MLLTKRWTGKASAAAGDSKTDKGTSASRGEKATEGEPAVKAKKKRKGAKGEAHPGGDDIASAGEAPRAAKKAARSEAASPVATIDGASAKPTPTPKREAAITAATSGGTSAKPKPAPKRESKKARRRRHKRNLRTKEPEVAAAYLQAWACREDPNAGDGSPWKFNKATQAWLLRHCYDTTRVPKDSFRMLLRYIVGLRGGARERLRAEAGEIITLRGAPLKTPDEAETKEVQHPSEEAEDTLGATDDAEPQLSEAEVKARKLRLRRAKQIVAALGTGAENSVGSA